MIKTIVLDAGHGGDDFGAIANGLNEKDINLKISLKIRFYLLRFWHCKIELTRETDEFISLKERTDFANKINADLFYSIHSNSFNGKATGYEDFIFEKLKDHSRTSEIRNMIHVTLDRKILSRYKIEDRGKKKANFYVLRQTKMPAVLVENLFIDNPQDAKLLKDRHFLHKLSLAHAKGIALAMGLDRKMIEDSNINDDNLWIVQAGAYKSKERAKEMANTLNKAGFDAFVKRCDE